VQHRRPAECGHGSSLTLSTLPIGRSYTAPIFRGAAVHHFRCRWVPSALSYLRLAPNNGAAMCLNLWRSFLALPSLDRFRSSTNRTRILARASSVSSARSGAAVVRPLSGADRLSSPLMRTADPAGGLDLGVGFRQLAKGVTERSASLLGEPLNIVFFSLSHL